MRNWNRFHMSIGLWQLCVVCDLCNQNGYFFFFLKKKRCFNRISRSSMRLWKRKMYIKFDVWEREIGVERMFCRSFECGAAAATVEWDHQSHSIKWNCLFLFDHRVCILYALSATREEGKWQNHFILLLYLFRPPRANYELLSFTFNRQSRKNWIKHPANWISKFLSTAICWWWWNIYKTRMSDWEWGNADVPKNPNPNTEFFFWKKMWRYQGQWDKHAIFSARSIE